MDMDFEVMSDPFISIRLFYTGSEPSTTWNWIQSQILALFFSLYFELRIWAKSRKKMTTRQVFLFTHMETTTKKSVAWSQPVLWYSIIQYYLHEINNTV